MEIEMKTITMKDLEVQFVSKKENKYKTMMYYFKIVDYQARNKLKIFLIHYQRS